MLDKERKLNRWDEYDYGDIGYYFITVCAHKFLKYFGKIVGEEMILNQAGKIVEECWRELPKHFPEVELEEFVIMPNHFHGIIGIVGNAYMRSGPQTVGNGYIRSVPVDRTKMGLPIIVQNFKAAVSREINKKFPDLNFYWQKSYYDRVVRKNHELGRIQWYIINNPARWALDRNNPENLAKDIELGEDDGLFLKPA